MTENLLTEDLTEEPQLDPNKNYFDELVGPGKKFADKEALAKGKAYGDIHAKIVEKKLDLLREDYLKEREQNQAKATLEDLIDRYNKKQTTSSEGTHSESREEKPSLKLEEVESLFDSRIQKYEAQKKDSENFSQVKNKLKEVFGNRYQDILSKQIEDLGLTVDEANNMAKRSPQAFYKMMGMDQQKKTDIGIPSSSIRSDNFKGTERERTMSYYLDLKKSNPKLFHDRDINIQMEKDAQRLGERFFDTD